MPRYLQVLLNCLLLFALFQVAPDQAVAQQDIWVSAGQPVGLTATSGYGASDNGTPCGPDNSYTCYGGTFPPNGDIHWTVDGAPASSSYDTVNSSRNYCSADGNVNYYTYCSVYWDESGFYSVLAPGDHTVTAFLPGSQDPNAAFSTSWNVHVAKPIPSLSVSCSPNPISFGSQNTNCTASQSAGTGSLTWTINGGYWTTTGINGSAGGFAGWGVGNYTIGVSYSGDNDYGGTSTSTVLTISKSTPNVSVTCTPNPISYGSQTSTCTAQTLGGSGTITTYWDGNTWCSGAAPGPVSCTGWNGQPVGNHTFSASYSGDGNYNPASASTTLVINQGPPPISLSCSPSSLRVGQQTTCTASIPGATGTVAFYSPTSLTGQWWNGNSSSWYPQSGGNSPLSSIAITNDGALNYNINGTGFSWPESTTGGPPGLNQEFFYARWTGTFVSSIGGTYTIGVNSDDGANLYVNGTQIISNLGGVQGATSNLTYTQSATISLTAGATNTLVVEYQQGYGGAGIQLLWTPPGASSPSLLGWSVVPLDSGGHTSISGPIMVGGNSTVTAAYSGDGTYNPGSANTSITATSTAVVEFSGDTNPSNVGQGVTFTTLVHTGGAKPTANVAILDSGSQLENVTPSPVSATNLLPNSQQFGNSPWGGYCGPTSNMTLNAFDTTAPDGSYTATKFVVPSSFVCGQTPSWGVLTWIPGGLQEGKTYTASVWLRGENGGENVIIALNDCSPTGVTLTTSWKRYVATYPSIPDGIANCSTGPRGFQVLDNTQPNATFYVWGAQTEMSDHAGPYIQTDASSRSGYGGIASFSINSLTQGTHLIAANYSGDVATAAALSPAIAQVVGTPSGGPPSIAWLTPTSGYPGAIVTINGLNFGASQGSSSVTLSGLNPSVSSWSDTSIAFQVPATATSGNVIVTVNGTPSNGALFTVNSGPPTQSVTTYSYEIEDGSGNSGYAPNGSVVAYSDSVNGTWSNIGYDALNRLGSATQSVSGFTQYLCWSYDSFGNRLAQMVSGSPCSNPPPTVSYNSNNQIQGLSYDAAGNLTNDGKNQYLYDAEGRVCAVQYQVQPGWPSTMMGYIYDAEGRRVAKGSISQWNCDMDNNGFTETAGYVLGPNGEQMTETDGQGNWVHTNVYANGELIATYTPSGLSFHLNDWLGTRRMDTDPFGNPGTTYQSMPFGELLNPAQSITSPEHFYTGKERDSESGLDYFGARHYSSTIGRFLTPDYSEEPEAVPFSDLNNPQSLNLYGYVQNDPLSNMDADGHVRCPDGNEADVCVTTPLPDPPGIIFGINLQRLANWTVQAASNTIQNLSNLSHIMNTPGGPSCVGSLVTGGAMVGSGAMALPGLSGIVGGPTVLLSEGGAVLGGGLVGGVAGGTAAMSMCPGAGGGGSGGNGGSGGPKKWKITNPADKKVIGGRTYLKDAKTGTWWSKDTAGHGGSAWKVFVEEPGGLRWIADADEQGNYIVGKWKSPDGMFVRFK